MSGPEIYEPEYSDKVEEGLLSRVVFTEIDHNYVNPIAYQSLKRINKVFSDVEKWNMKKTDTWFISQDYRSGWKNAIPLTHHIKSPIIFPEKATFS